MMDPGRCLKNACSGRFQPPNADSDQAGRVCCGPLDHSCPQNRISVDQTGTGWQAVRVPVCSFCDPDQRLQAGPSRIRKRRHGPGKRPGGNTSTPVKTPHGLRSQDAMTATEVSERNCGSGLRMAVRTQFRLNPGGNVLGLAGEMGSRH